ncbi:MAG TPA: hypothetical protein VG916_00685 [Gemmatimonadaceae bacterium]|nr:hypothetical protein [Gemmatimonadaceae bacterium]
MNAPRMLMAAATAAALMAAPTVARAQADTANQKPFVYKTDFAVPDAPAFSLLTVSDGAILRPQSYGSVAVALSGFRGASGGFAIPKELGIEFSPGVLMASGPVLRATDMRRYDWLYRLRVSLAARRDSAGTNGVALGFRYSLMDDAALTDSAVMAKMQQELTPYTATIVKIVSEGSEKVTTPQERAAGKPFKLLPEDEAKIAAVQAQIRKAWADANWNANALDVAVAARALTADTLGHDPEVDQVAGWFTVARRWTSAGQILFGGQAASVKDSSGTFRTSVAIAARLYLGSNDGKFFIEGQTKSTEQSSASQFVNAGLEFRLAGIGWVDAGWGYESGGALPKARSVVTFKLKSAGLGN